MATEKPEIDWGESEQRLPGNVPQRDLLERARRFETDEQRRRRQQVADQDALEQSAARRRRRAAAAAAVLAVAAIAGAGVADRLGLITLPLIHAAPAIAATPAAPPTIAAAEPAPTRAPLPEISPEISAPEPAAAPVVLVSAPAIDQEQLRRVSSRLEHAQAGIGVISRERDHKLGELQVEDQLLRGSYNPTPRSRRRDSLYDQAHDAAVLAVSLQRSAQSGQPGAAHAYANQVTIVENLNAQIGNTIRNETHDLEVLASLSDRLAKATAERDRLAAELAAVKAGTAIAP